MSLVINTNVASLNSQRQLMQSGNALDQATERLSSGNRINSAKDDAAGLAIANRMTSQIRGLDQAIRNANDGVSMIQTAEGALQEVTNILQRIGELAVQSANEIYNDGDREYLQSEVTQLIEELDRISSSTSFNGQKLLDGTLGAVNLQVGAEANQVMTVEVGSMNSKNLGGGAGGDIVGSALTITGAGNGTDSLLTLAGNVTINGQTLTGAALQGAQTVNELLAVINDGVSNITATAVTEVTAASDGDGVIRGTDSLDLTLTNADGSTSSFEIRDTGSMEELVEKINAETGGKVQASLNDNGRLVLASNTGARIAVAGAGAAAAGLTAGETHNPRLSLSSNDGTGVTITYGTPADAAIMGIDARSEAGDITGRAATVAGLAEGDLVINGVDIGAVAEVTAGTPTAADQAGAFAEAINKLSHEHGVVASVAGDGLTLNSVSGAEMSIEVTAAGATATGLQSVNNATTVGDAVANIDISTAAGAQKAIDTIDRAMTTISETRADLGAINNRLDFTIANLANVSEKTSAARARIMDADFAAETANLSRAQVLQQAATAMLAQANARPQQVLQLLQ